MRTGAESANDPAALFPETVRAARLQRLPEWLGYSTAKLTLQGHLMATAHRPGSLGPR